MTSCRYCQQPAVLLRIGSAGYPYQRDYGPIWTCVPCRAWVGVHPGTEKPLGGLANAELRAAKQAAHAAFDQLWKTGPLKRREAYSWLAQQLKIEFKDCHIGMFDLDQCRAVVTVMKARAL